MYHSFDQRIWFTVIFIHLEENRILSQTRISFVKLSSILSQFLLSWGELQKYNPTVLIENCDQAIWPTLFLYATLHKVWLFEKLIFELKVFSPDSKINSILARQLKSLKKW